MKNLMWLLSTVSILLTACNNSSSLLLNNKAALPENFKFDTMGLKVMSSSIQKRSGTMSILYANQATLTNATHGDKSHHAGELLALATWKQQDDDHWFGARIPGDLESVEVVKISDGTTSPIISYNKYNGKNLAPDTDSSLQHARIKYILDQAPSIMP